jgi:hypothetical protein
MRLAQTRYDGRPTPPREAAPTVPAMQEPSRSGPRPLDLLIALFAVLNNIVAAAMVIAWDSLRRAIARLDP